MSTEEYLKTIISAQGPLTFAQYMSIALSDSRHGYYTTKQPFGKKGDFITAPEISQMFGELIGIWAASLWQASGTKEEVAIVELGPGRGTLMHDFLSGTKNVLGFHNKISIHLIEISPKLKDIQKEALRPFSDKIKVQWHNTFDEIPAKPAIIVANEFFDALPVHQFINTENGWRENMVGINAEGDLDIILSPSETTSCALIPKKRRNSPIGAIIETCPAAIAITRDIAEHINKNGGAALFIDYGYDEPIIESTLQSVKNHKFHDLLKAPGSADITAHVDFLLLKQVAEECMATAYGPIEQGSFLHAVGINIRADMLKNKADEKHKKDIDSALERLTDSSQMGELFKCIALTHPQWPMPEGFKNV